MPPSSVPSQAVAPRRSTRSKGNTSHFSDVVRPSSPPKNTDNFPKSRDVLETFVRSQGSNIDEKFLSRHLRSPPKRLTLKQPQDNSQISAIVKAGKLSCKIYKPLAKLLTNFSRRIHGTYIFINLKISFTDFLAK